jgi:hypothetical protein
MDVLEKLRIMLPHWIEHNRSHQQEFASWVEQLAKTDGALAYQLSKAVSSLEHTQEALQQAMELTGGTLSGESGHGHQDHH